MTTTSTDPRRIETPEKRVGPTGTPVGWPVLTFEPEGHVYRLHDAATPAAWGQILPSVTQVLEAVGLVDDEWFTEDSRTRGRYVHRMIQFHEREGLDESTVDPRLAGYLTAYRAFIRDMRPGPCLLLETPLADPTLRYAGTPDQVREIKNRLALIDHKSGGSAPWHRLQTAAYVDLVGKHNGEFARIDRYALYLRRDGQYRLEQHTGRRDIKVFHAALAVAHWKESL